MNAIALAGWLFNRKSPLRQALHKLVVRPEFVLSSTHCLLVKYTYKGDANLDGQVDLNDLYQLDQGWLLTGQTWYTGDFDYNGSTNAVDLGLIAVNWQNGVGHPMVVEEGGDNTTDQFTTGISGLGLSSDDVDALLAILGSNAGGLTL